DLAGAWRDRSGDRGEALELLLRFRPAEEGIEMLLRGPLRVIHHFRAIEAAMETDRDEAALVADRAFRRLRQRCQQLGLPFRRDLVDIDQGQHRGLRIDRRGLCHCVLLFPNDGHETMTILPRGMCHSSPEPRPPPAPAQSGYACARLLSRSGDGWSTAPCRPSQMLLRTNPMPAICAPVSDWPSAS